MPCLDGGPSYEQAEAQRNIPRALCGAMTVLERMGLVDEIDFKESGVTKKWLMLWWENHKEADAERKKREQREAEQEETRINALAKLSKKEREALRL